MVWALNRLPKLAALILAQPGSAGGGRRCRRRALLWLMRKMISFHPRPPAPNNRLGWKLTFDAHTEPLIGKNALLFPGERSPVI